MNTPFTYLVIHVPTGQWYYGVRYSKNCQPSDLWSTYFTSSKSIKDLIKHDGITSFKVEVRKVFDNEYDAIQWESRVLKKILGRHNCLNESAFPAVSSAARMRGNITRTTIKENGMTIAQKTGMLWKLRQYEINQETGLTYKEIRRRKYNETMISKGGRDRVTNATKIRMKYNNPSKRDEVRQKISNTLSRKIASGEIKTTKGRSFPSISQRLMGNDFSKDLIWVTNGEIDMRVKKSKIPFGFMLGRSSPNNKGHKYELKICPYCDKEGAGGNMRRYHFDNCKKKSKLELNISSNCVVGL